MKMVKVYLKRGEIQKFILKIKNFINILFRDNSQHCDTLAIPLI